jgi:hypothetical protein
VIKGYGFRCFYCDRVNSWRTVWNKEKEQSMFGNSLLVLLAAIAGWVYFSIIFTEGFCFDRM